MRALSEKIGAVAPSATIEITDAAKKMKREGIDVISLSIGEPDFATPEHIVQACSDALARGETHYAPSAGIPELLHAVAAKCRTENGIPCGPENVIATCGAKDAIYEAMQACLNPGDEVILPDPAWVSYEPCVQMADGRVVHLPLKEPSFQIDDAILERVGQKTKMIIVNTPSNPAGTVLSKASLKLVADLCEDYDLLALSDEIYEKLIYGKEHISLAALGDMAERTITINGFSKAYAMTGWRLGYAVAPLPVLRQMMKVQQHSISSPTTFVMWGGVAALQGDQSCVEAMRKEFEARRMYMLDEFTSMGYTVAPPDGAFYAFVKVEGDDMAIARAWLNEAHVAATPGTAFNAPGWIRVSYAASIPTLKEAMRRIRAWKNGQ
ncbi:MAG: pyridoxal phosphate-dependent aminotransferase [Methanofollis sp.]|uniref:pyridoxal phosphate-dependent aminotransferase n=1 Tax=Methanofollis sp. TaxID=2052835 RepID=UPI0026354FCF|nr:pyridoxal phosphate-dependent aminotransferase [Methanofollis sp.]MDD4255492.1 pyridoxal phosphate-dependent aminotransferase [Methanofollis sp.]